MNSPRKSNSMKKALSPKKSKFNDAVALFLSILMNSREQAHILHLQTNSYASHKALNGYYDEIVDLIDKYAEAYQGKYGIIYGYQPMNMYLEGDKNILPYFFELTKSIEAMKKKLPNDLDLENVYADILDLLHSTLYLLVNLK